MDLSSLPSFSLSLFNRALPPTEDALQHPWLATTTSEGSATLPLLVSSLPFNSGAASSSALTGDNSTSLTSPAISHNEDSFVDSQGMGVSFSPLVFPRER